MKFRFIILSSLLLTLIAMTGISFSTTWVPSESTDPLSGEKVPSQTIMSYGTYIYDWPSKYDLVFWPLIDENWIVINPGNGYTAFSGDFEKLTEEEKRSLKSWLKENYTPSVAPKSHKEKLEWLEKVYRQREMDDEFWCRFYRLMAFIHQDDTQTAEKFVRKAMTLLLKKLQNKPVGVELIEVLYLLGEYNRRLGETDKAREFFSQMRDVKFIDRDGKEQIGHPYFVKLVEEREKLEGKPTVDKGDAVVIPEK